MKEFLDWHRGHSHCIPFQGYEKSKFWCYADYIYILEMFKNEPDFDISQEIAWKNIGFTESDGKDSAIWIGTEGSHTVCHYDTYGFNIVYQVNHYCSQLLIT